MERSPQLLLFLNPIGSALEAAIVPNLGFFAGGYRTLEAELAAFGYILSVAEAGSLDVAVPISPLTGEPFIVTDKGETIEIAGPRSDGGEPAVRFEFRKP